MADRQAKYDMSKFNEYDLNDEGKTILSFEFDHQLNIKFEKNLRNGYINENVNLIKANEYDAINEARKMHWKKTQ